MVYKNNTKTACRIEVIINNTVVHQQSFNIPMYEDLSSWQPYIESRENYLNKKIDQVKANYDLLGVEYSVAIYLDSKGEDKISKLKFYEPSLVKYRC